MTTIYVTYAGDAATRFDRDYDVAAHIPLFLECWGPYGLESCAAFFPPGDGAGTIVYDGEDLGVLPFRWR